MPLLDRIGDAAVKVLVRLAADQIVEETVSELLTYLSHTTPEELLKHALADSSLRNVPREELAKWERRIRAGARAALKLNKAQLVRRTIQELTPEDVFKLLATKAAKQRDKTAYTNINFMVNTPTAMRWFAKKVNETKEYILKVFDETVAKSSV